MSKWDDLRTGMYKHGVGELERLKEFSALDADDAAQLRLCLEMLIECRMLAVAGADSVAAEAALVAAVQNWRVAARIRVTDEVMDTLVAGLEKAAEIGVKLLVGVIVGL